MLAQSRKHGTLAAKASDVVFLFIFVHLVRFEDSPAPCSCADNELKEEIVQTAF